MAKANIRKCPNCGNLNAHFRQHFNDVRWHEVLTYYKCLSCFVEFHTNLPSPEEFYTSGEYRRRADIPENRAKQITAHRARGQVKWMDRFYPQWRLDVKTILDIGAYMGIATGILRSQGFDAVGFDPDPREAAKSEFVHTEVSVTGNYDLLWLSHVLEHAESAIDMLTAYKPMSSRAFIEVPLGNYQLPHILTFRRDSLAKTVELAGMNIVVDQNERIVVEW